MTCQKNLEASSPALSQFIGGVCGTGWVVQIQTHISKYKCSADSCVPFHMLHIGRILNTNKINLILFENQVTKLLFSTMIHLELFPNTASVYTAFPLKLLVQNENQWALLPLSFLLSLLLHPWLTKATHYSTFKSCKVCGISSPGFRDLKNTHVIHKASQASLGDVFTSLLHF